MDTVSSVRRSRERGAIITNPSPSRSVSRTASLRRSQAQTPQLVPRSSILQQQQQQQQYYHLTPNFSRHRRNGSFNFHNQHYNFSNRPTILEQQQQHKPQQQPMIPRPSTGNNNNNKSMLRTFSFRGQKADDIFSSMPCLTQQQQQQQISKRNDNESTPTSSTLVLNSLAYQVRFNRSFYDSFIQIIRKRRNKKIMFLNDRRRFLPRCQNFMALSRK